MQYRFYGWETADVRDANGVTPRDMYDLLSAVWNADTCAPRMRSGWTIENRTLGQCSVTAFLIQDLYGGKVYGVPLGDGNFHCYNMVEDCVFDLTSEQFGDTALHYENNPEQLREIHFAKEEKRRRYETLRARFLGEYAVMLKHSGFNCCQAVLCTYARQTNLSSDLLRGIGAGFGVGMGCMEATCGALCAAEMLMGLKTYKGAPLLRSAKTLHQAFQRACGATLCRELKGLDTGRVLCECDDCVRRAVELAEKTGQGFELAAEKKKQGAAE